MRLTILGSSGGYPAPGRACSGYLIRTRNTTLWVDCGTGTLDAVLRHASLSEIDAILLSHLHPDHWTDLPIALHQKAVTRTRDATGPIPVLGPAGWPAGTGVAAQWFSDDRNIFISDTLNDGKAFSIGEIRVQPCRVEHGMPVFAFRFSADVRSLVYSADTRPCAQLLELARDADLFLCETTLPAGEETAISMNPEQAGRLAASAGVRELVLTHLLPGIVPDDSCSEAARHFNGPVSYADPGRTFVIGSKLR
jgi:ribonuclease BN (tRNA processing enzyme)